MSFIVYMLLFVGLCGWLDARLGWPAPAGTGRIDGEGR
jgi:hypothetical protein